MVVSVYYGFEIPIENVLARMIKLFGSEIRSTLETKEIICEISKKHNIDIHKIIDILYEEICSIIKECELEVDYVYNETNYDISIVVGKKIIRTSRTWNVSLFDVDTLKRYDSSIKLASNYLCVNTKPSLILLTEEKI